MSCQEEDELAFVQAFRALLRVKNVLELTLISVGKVGHR
jgi:hypothetical protein